MLYRIRTLWLPQNRDSNYVATSLRMDLRTHRRTSAFLKARPSLAAGLCIHLTRLAFAFPMPPEPTFSRSHLSAFRTSLMAATTMTTKSLPQQATTSTAVPSCCHRQRHAIRSQNENSPLTTSDTDDLARSTQSPTSDSPSCTSSPATAPSSPLSSPPSSRPPSADVPQSPVPGKVSVQCCSEHRAAEH